MRDRRIGVLALQETHLTNEIVNTIQTLYGRRLHILWSAPDHHASSSQGIAFVLSREITNITGAKLIPIIPGRAALLTLPWHNDKVLNLLNVYALNSATSNAAFWQTLSDKWASYSISPVAAAC